MKPFGGIKRSKGGENALSGRKIPGFTERKKAATTFEKKMKKWKTTCRRNARQGGGHGKGVMPEKKHIF